MLWRVEVSIRPGFFDSQGEGIKKGIEDLGILAVTSCSTSQVYYIQGEIPKEDVALISRRLLMDSVTQDYSISLLCGLLPPLPNKAPTAPSRDIRTVEVAYNPGVMDPVEASVKRGIEDLGVGGVSALKTAVKYVIRGKITDSQLITIRDNLLLNDIIQHQAGSSESPFVDPPCYRFEPVYVQVLGAHDDNLNEISRTGQLSLNLDEMRAIRNHFTYLGRNPTDAELETIAQTWSEHCVHKTFKGIIEYEGERIDNLLKSTIMKVTEELDKDWCVSVFEDNAGIVKFDENYNLCFKVETHNHPSALEPYGGAGTGTGGAIRDPLGTGLGAKPIINTDVFCFGPLDLPYDKLPSGCLHPKRVFKGVVAGVGDYGNRMGIPTVNGAIYFDEGYIGNPLVYCGNVGILPVDKSFKKLKDGDYIVLVGGRTGRDGIHGVTFSSDALTDSLSSGVVQIGNAITEKKMVDVIMEARDLDLYSSITDCGGGGLSSAVGEMGVEIGAEVDLDRVPLKYEGLSYTEIWISESQERMILAVPPQNVQELIQLCAEEDVEATVIGKFTGDKRLKLRYERNVVCDLDMNFLHNGLPRLNLKATWDKPYFEEPDLPDPSDLTPILKSILSSPNVCSKEWVIRQYDHEVQGGSVLKPLQGVRNDGPGDASVTRPVMNSTKGIVLSVGLNPKYGKIDPYHMAASAIDEALRQVISVGGTLEHTALLDNFCWGSPYEPEGLGGLVRAAKACYDIARVYETPFISGKDSLNNEFVVRGKSVPIPPALLISAISVVDDVQKVISMDFKEPGNLIYVVGTTYDELGASHFYDLNGYTGNNCPVVRPSEGKRTMDALSAASSERLIRACHDCSEGGIGVAVSEMCFSGEVGASISLAEVPTSHDNAGAGPRVYPIERNDTILFSESNSRFIVEVALENRGRFEEILKDVAFGVIGKTTADTELVITRLLAITGLNEAEVVRADIFELKEAWQSPLRDI